MRGIGEIITDFITNVSLLLVLGMYKVRNMFARFKL